MHASISPAAGACALHRGDGRLGEVVERTQRSKYMTCSWCSLPSGVARMAAHGSVALEHLLEVVAGAEVLALAGQDDHPDVVVGLGQVEGAVELVDELGVQGVGRLGPAQRDRGDRAVDVVADRRRSPRRHHASARPGAGPGRRAASQRVRARLAGQAEHALADDVALDLVGAGQDRGRLVVEPRALPLAVARVVRRRRASSGGAGPSTAIAGVVQALAHLAPRTA